MRSRRSRSRLLVVVGGAAWAFAAVVACTGDDETFRDDPVHVYDAATFDRRTPPGTATDALAPTFSCGDAAGAPPRLLVTSRTQPELAAYNLQSRAIDGRYFIPDGGLGFTSAANSDPWLIDRTHGVVTRLDPAEPWKAIGSWDVGDDAGDGGSEPAVVVQVSCTKAYVIQANRDRIAIIDPSRTGAPPSGGVRPTGHIDLSAYRADGSSGSLDLTNAVWVPAKKKVFVLAGNNPFEAAGIRCTDLKPALFAIDVATDTVVSLAGRGPAGSIELEGYAPPAGTSLVYDAPFDRILALTAGCYAPPADGSIGQTRRRLIEQVDLATGAVKTLVTLESGDAPTSLTVLDADHALVGFGSRVRYWDPHLPALGPELDGGVDIPTLDGRGGYAGVYRRILEDGGAARLDLIGIPIDVEAGVNEGPRLFSADPFSTPGGSAASLEPWPHR